VSTKIYHARRIPAGKLNDFLDWSRTQILDRITKRVRELMERSDLSDWKPGKGCTNAYLSEQYERFNRVMNEAKQASVSTERDPFFNLDCGFNLWIDGRYIYLVPIMEDWMQRGLRFPEWATDYSYWNNSDQPSNVSGKEWKARAETWDRICTGEGPSSHNARRLWFEIVDMKSPVPTIVELWHGRLEPYFKRTKHALQAAIAYRAKQENVRAAEV